MMLEGVQLMIVGMLTVFVFLTLLVGLMKASAAFFEANAHRFPDEESATAMAPGSQGRGTNDEEIAVAIALAHAMRQGRSV